MNEGTLAIAGCIAFFLLLLWHMPDLWKNIGAVVTSRRKKIGRGQRQRKQFVLQANCEVRQKELEIERTLEKLATCHYHPDLKLLKEVELHKKMLELRLLDAPLGTEERRQLDDEMTIVRGQIKEQKKKLNMNERR
jgi:hypothetical protein